MAQRPIVSPEPSPDGTAARLRMSGPIRLDPVNFVGIHEPGLKWTDARAMKLTPTAVMHALETLAGTEPASIPQ